LKQLDWKHNYLSTILDENPLVSPPLSVCVLGFRAMEKWYQENATSVGSINLDDAQSSIDGNSTSRFSLRRSPHFYNH